MPYVSNQGLRIHYEVERRGPPLVLQHGLTSNMERWRTCGYVQELSGDYSLILIDARGHGNSEKPQDTRAYCAELMTGDVVAVLNELEVDRANYWGYSMGGKIGFNLPRYHPSRFTSYIIGGMSPYPRMSEAEKQWAAGLSMMLRLGAEEGPEAMMRLQEKTLGRPVSAEERVRMLENDYKALYALYQNLSNWPATGGLLSSINVPCLLYAGERDAYFAGAIEAVKHIQKATFVAIPDLMHAEVSERSDLILPHAKRFLSRVVAGN